MNRDRLISALINAFFVALWVSILLVFAYLIHLSIVGWGWTWTLIWLGVYVFVVMFFIGLVRARGKDFI